MREWLVVRMAPQAANCYTSHKCCASIYNKNCFFMWGRGSQWRLTKYWWMNDHFQHVCTCSGLLWLEARVASMQFCRSCCHKNHQTVLNFVVVLVLIVVVVVVLLSNLSICRGCKWSGCCSCVCQKENVCYLVLNKSWNNTSLVPVRVLLNFKKIFFFMSRTLRISSATTATSSSACTHLRWWWFIIFFNIFFHQFFITYISLLLLQLVHKLSVWARQEAATHNK